MYSGSQMSASQEADEVADRLREGLLQATLRHHRFLAVVDALGDVVYSEAFLKLAVRRYELLWLPLCAQHPELLEPDAIHGCPPLDVAWAMHCHMLNPKMCASCVTPSLHAIGKCRNGRAVFHCIVLSWQAAACIRPVGTACVLERGFNLSARLRIRTLVCNMSWTLQRMLCPCQLPSTHASA